MKPLEWKGLDIREGLTRLVESGFLPGDDADLRLKKVALTLVPMIIGPAAFLWGTIYFLLGHPLSGSIPMSYSIVSAASLIYFFKSKETQFIQFSQLLLVLLLPFLLMWSLGGFAASSMVMIWAIYAPIAALMFLEKRDALLWFLAYFALILISGLIDGAVSEAVPPLPALAREAFFLLNMGCGSAGLYLLTSYAIREEKRAIESLKGEQLKLEERSGELNRTNQRLNKEIAERERVKSEREMARDQAEEFSRMLQTVLDTIPVRIFWKDRNLVYLGCNRLFARDSGKTSPLELIGKTDYDMGWREMADLYRTDDAFVMNTRQPKLNFEEQQPHQDGSTTWLRTSKVALCDAAGEVIGVLGTYEDITEEKQIAQALVAAKDAAESASRAKSEFLASMSHELRTPLNAILGFSQLLGMNPDLPGDPREQAREIEQAGNHLLSLVNDLIDLSCIESGKLALSLAPLPVMPVVADSLALVAPIARQHGIELIDASGICRTAIVLADYVRLRQVMINLLSNAIKYNGSHGSVRLSCNIGDGKVRISVADTGPGIPAGKQARIFRAFDRLGVECGQEEGAGIGLVITKNIVEAMGGSIGFASVEGQGSTFWIEFPLCDAAEHPVPGAVTARARTAITQPTTHPVVLYVEDNPMNLRLMQKVFAMRDCVELRDALTAEIGIGMAQAEPPDLILMDINLPGMDGYEALAVLRADPRTAHIPVIAITANAMKGDMERGLKSGFADYLTKPLDIPRLFAQIDALLRPGEARGGTD